MCLHLVLKITFSASRAAPGILWAHEGMLLRVIRGTVELNTSFQGNLASPPNHPRTNHPWVLPRALQARRRFRFRGHRRDTRSRLAEVCLTLLVAAPTEDKVLPPLQ